MKNEELLHKLINEIGDEYHYYEFLVYQEFPLEVKIGDLIYDRYLATGKLKMKLGLPKNNKIALYFNADVLSNVEVIKFI